MQSAGLTSGSLNRSFISVYVCTYIYIYTYTKWKTTVSDSDPPCPFPEEQSCVANPGLKSC